MFRLSICARNANRHRSSAWPQIAANIPPTVREKGILSEPLDLGGIKALFRGWQHPEVAERVAH